MKKNLMKLVAMMAAVVAVMVTPMQVKAAEVAQPAAEEETIRLVEDGYYREVEKDGVFNRHDAEGNLISSTKVEDALFKVNSTLTEGWGKGTINGSHTEGTFKNATLDKKGYFRCSFTTDAGITYDQVVVKVDTQDWMTWAVDIAIKDAADKATANATINAVVSVDGDTDSNLDSSSGSSSGSSSSSGSTGDRRPGGGNTGWTEPPSSSATSSSAPSNHYQGWFD